MHLAIESAPAVFMLPGQTECGDRHVVVPRVDGALIAVIDGLGHGGEAALAARLAAEEVQRHAHDESLTRIMRHCHEAVASTRGVVMNLAAFDATEQTLAWLGVGNVEGRLLLRTSDGGHAQQSLLQRSGIVGHQLPELQESVTRVRRGDTLIFATDGISANFADDIRVGRPARDIAKHVIATHCKETDDALVLAVTYLG